MSIKGWLQNAIDLLHEAGVDTPKLDAELLLAHHLGINRSTILAHLNDPLKSAPDHLLQRRIEREPLAYITGHIEFYGRDFQVSPSVLIPRQDTECLIDAVLNLPLPPQARIHDLGTGSGCIAITLKSERPMWQVSASDISAEALAIAKINAQELSAKIEFIEQNGLPEFNYKIDCLVSNPPYIDPTCDLMPEVKSYEPHLALFAEESGYAFYSHIAECTPKTTSYIALEIGMDMEERVCQIFDQNGWQCLSQFRDLSNIIRVLIFQPE